jgi:hypothetical protein
MVFNEWIKEPGSVTCWGDIEWNASEVRRYYTPRYDREQGAARGIGPRLL